MLPTVQEILALPALARGRPRVVAGHRGLGNRVRWAHVSELPDMGNLIQGGELVLTTGIALPDEPQLIAEFIKVLADGQASALVVELGRRYVGAVPAAMLRSAEARALPLVVLDRPTPFVTVTRAVHEQIISDQFEALNAAEEAQQVFTELILERADYTEVVRRLAMMSGTPVVLESLSHQVFAYHFGSADAADILSLWADRSRRADPARRIAYLEDLGWLVALVGTNGQDWARLVLICGERPSARLWKLAERGASALVLARMVLNTPPAAGGVRRIDAVPQPFGSTADLHTAARAFGFPSVNRTAVSIVLRRCGAGRAGAPTASDMVSGLLSAAAKAGLPALVDQLGDDLAGGLLSLPVDGSWETAVTSLVDALPAAVRGSVVVGVGGVTDRVDGWRHAVLEARRVASVVTTPAPREAGAGFFTAADVGLDGLFAQLRHDERVHEFVEHTLSPLLRVRDGEELLQVLRVYLELGHSKTMAADALHMSRPALYKRLRRIERLLDTDLDAGRGSLTLHVAVVAHDEIIRSRPAAPRE
ncbi:MAG TPA: PucR family transcriptional regulator [Rugosimonospora sp.]|jgi:purine catabolism regulator